MIRFTAVAFAALLATSAFASEPAGHDDVSYGDIPRASFDVPLVQPDGVSVVGSQFDDVQYAPPAERPTAKKSSDTRVAEKTACHCHAS